MYKVAEKLSSLVKGFGLKLYIVQLNKKSDSSFKYFCEPNVCDVMNDDLGFPWKKGMINCEENTWKGKRHHLHLALMLMNFSLVS